MASEEKTANKLLINQSSTTNFYCNIEVAGSAIPPRNISYLSLREWVLPSSLVPRLELCVFDDGLLTELLTPYYNQTIYLELGRSEDDDDPIELTFDIYDYVIDKSGDQGKNMVTISATIAMETPHSIPPKPIAFDNKNSAEVIEILGNALLSPVQSRYEFKSESVTPSDTMTWIQSYQSNLNFLKTVLSSSHIGLNDTALCFIDTKGIMWYTGAVAAFNQASSYTARFDVQMGVSQSMSEMKSLAVGKGYTEVQAENDIWYSSINFRDYSGTIRNTHGFAVESTFFDRSTSQYTSNTFNINVNNTDGDIYQPYMNNRTTYKYSGCVGINEPDNSKNSSVIKQNILSQLFAQSVLIESNSYSQVKLLDTIDLNVSADIKVSSDFPINERLSGKYLVGGITHAIGGPGSLYKKILTLFRTGVNTSGFTGVE